MRRTATSMPRYTFAELLPRGADCFLGVGAGISFQNAARQGCRARAYMDLFTAILKRNTSVRTLAGIISTAERI